MAIGAAFAAATLRFHFSRGCQLSLHTRDPGPDGGAGRIAGPFVIAPGALRISGAVMTLARDIEPGVAFGGGRARYVGVWTVEGLWAMSLEMPSPVDVTRGEPVTFRRELVRLELT